MYPSLEGSLFCADKIEALKQLKDIDFERKSGKRTRDTGSKNVTRIHIIIKTWRLEDNA